MGPPSNYSSFEHFKPERCERPDLTVKNKRTIGFQVAIQGGTLANRSATQYSLGQNIPKYYTLSTPIKVKQAFCESGGLGILCIKPDAMSPIAV